MSTTPARALGLLILLAAFPLPVSRAVVVTWTNSAGGDFTNAANWRAAAPTAADAVLFTNQASYTVTFSSSVLTSNVQFNVQGNGPGANVTFDLGGNTWTASQFADLATGSGTNFITLANGTLVVTNGSTCFALVQGNPLTSFTRLTLGAGGRFVGTNGTTASIVGQTAGSRAEFELLTGSHALLRQLRVATGGGTSGSIGTVLHSGGTNELGNLQLAQGTSTTGYYYMVGADALLLATNGVLTVGQGANSLGRMVISNGTVMTRAFTLGGLAGSTGQFVMAGGTVLLNGAASGNAGFQVSSGTGEILLSGGTLGNWGGSNWATSLSMTITNTGVGAISFGPSGTNTITLSGALVGDGSLIKAESGALVLNAGNTFSGNTVLQDGQLQLLNRLSLQNSTLVMTNAASLRLANSRTNVLGGLAGTTSIGLTNSTGLAVALYVGGNGASTEYSGSLGGSGSLIKEGSGTLNLSGDHSYSGTTTVSGGTLRVNGAYSGGALLSVASNATLGGTGSLADVALSDGALLAPGNSIGTLTVSNLTFTSASLFEFELAATNASDLVFALGTLTLAPLDFSNFTFTTNAGFGAGVYTLIDAAAHSGSFTTVTNADFFGYFTTLSLGGVDGNDLVLNLASAIPEPSAIALCFSASVLALLVGSRRRQCSR